MGVRLRGSSGARIYASNGVVRKVGTGAVGERVSLQGRWLHSHRASSLPRVTRTGDTNYDMEPLLAAPAWALDHKMIFDQLLESLQRDVWRHEPEVPYDAFALGTRITSLFHDCGLTDQLARWRALRDAVDWTELPPKLVHGDPTFDNVMFRESTGDLVIVDPLPSLITDIPDLRAVDLGKILQSIMGWEAVRYGSESERFRVDPATLKRELTENEWHATVLFGSFCLARTLRYVSDEEKCARLRELVGDTLSLA